jgi:hypothetical protein
MTKEEVKVGSHVSFTDGAGFHTAVVSSFDPNGNAILGSISPAIAGRAPVVKSAGDLTACA